jgi:hypothetical protein
MDRQKRYPVHPQVRNALAKFKRKMRDHLIANRQMMRQLQEIDRRLMETIAKNQQNLDRLVRRRGDEGEEWKRS